ncbi:hypothetical protein IL306_000450 [Fusarium sp. DS 682]|nr:hypothetical protein IL306_000450 [Fusarium sp. DS 682]
MASPQRISLERSLDQFRRELSDDQRREISGVNQKVLNHAIQEMQAKLGREKGLCKLTRIEKFLHVMQDIEKIVTIFLNVSEVVAFIWGPIKLALMAATTWKDCVRQLVDVYEEIADALDNLAFFHKLVQKREHEHLRLILEDYFSDILRFHRCVLDVFSRPEWKRLFKWAWGSFRRDVKPIMESLKRKQAMLSDDKLLSHAILKEVQDSHEYEKDQFRQLKAGLDDIKTSLAAEQLRNKSLQDEEMRASLESKLDISKSRIDCQLHSSESTVGSSGNWIFTHPTFDSWDTNKILQGDVLFLNGCPGAGMPLKNYDSSFLRANELSGEQGSRLWQDQSFVTYRTDTPMSLDHQTIMRFVYDKCSSMDYLDLSVLKELAQECLTSQQKAVLVLDGLDEATGNEPELSLRWCLNELLPAASSRGCHLKLLVCGQEDGRIEPFLSSYQQIRLHTVDSHREIIYEYSRSQAAHLRSRFSLTKTEEDDLIIKVVEASQGMFLYPKVVFANLEALDSADEFGDEMENNNFPKNLEQA